jgi:hypothetical protein
MELEGTKSEIDEYVEESYDNLLTTQQLLPHNDSMQPAHVIQRKRDELGNQFGLANDNPSHDTRTYEVQFSDGTIQEYAANIIAKSIFSLVDHEGKEYILLQDIIDHANKDDALCNDDAEIPGTPHTHRTTWGWDLLVSWRDGSSDLLLLKDLNESNPVQFTEYAIARNIASESAFSWWVNDIIKGKDMIISKLKSQYWNRTHKFGIRVPTSVQEALQLDQDSGTDLWQKAIKKEMHNVKPAFQVLEESDKVPPGNQHIKCHMIFDLKMDLT